MPFVPCLDPGRTCNCRFFVHGILMVLFRCASKAGLFGISGLARFQVRGMFLYIDWSD